MSENIIYIASLKAYNQTWDYYNRVIGDGGTLIDAEAVNRIYHGLNLLNLQNRSYKLYHASAGLQKTSDQIDKLYDLGKDDIDQTFSGSDRPETNALRNENEISVEKTSTNYLDYTGADLSSLENAAKCDYVNKTTNYLNSNWNSWEIGLQDNVDINDVSFRAFSISNNYQSNETFYAIVEYVSGSPTPILRGRIGISTMFYVSFDFNSVGTQGGGRVLSDSDFYSLDFEKLLSAGHGLTENDGDIYRFWGIMEIPDQYVGDGKGLWLEHETPSNEGGVYVLHFIQNEAREIFTSPIQGHTTRTAPEPVFENFLPHAEASQPLSFFLWTQDLFPRQDAGLNTMPWIFTIEGGALSYNFYYNKASNGRLISEWHGVHQLINNSQHQQYSRNIRFFFLSQDGANLKIFLGDDEGNIAKKIQKTYDSNNQTIPSRNLGLGVRLIASRLQTNVQGYALGSFSQHFSDNEVKNLYEATGKAVLGDDFKLKTYTDES